MEPESLIKVKELFATFPVPQFPIFIDNVDPGDIPLNSSEFLIKIIIDYNKNNNTVFLNKNGNKQTHTGCDNSRSISEIFYLIKFYYPNYTLNQYFADIYECIYQININQFGIFKSKFGGFSAALSVLFCPQISLPVFWTNGIINNDYQKYCINGDYLFKPKSKYFPIPFVWKTCNKTIFWTYFMEEDLIREIVGDKYLFLNNLNHPFIVKNIE